MPECAEKVVKKVEEVEVEEWVQMRGDLQCRQKLGGRARLLAVQYSERSEAEVQRSGTEQ